MRDDQPDWEVVTVRDMDLSQWSIIGDWRIIGPSPALWYKPWTWFRSRPTHDLLKFDEDLQAHYLPVGDDEAVGSVRVSIKDGEVHREVILNKKPRSARHK
jgi:hypothetical protein